MRPLHCVVLVWAAPLLAACANDTILSLNVSAIEDVGAIREIAVQVEQPGRAPLLSSFAPPSQTLEDGGMVIAPAFFERIELPERFDDGAATVSVEARSAAAAPPLQVSTMVELRSGGAVAAFVSLTREPPLGGDAMPDAGTLLDAAADGAAPEGGLGEADAGVADGTPGDGGV